MNPLSDHSKPVHGVWTLINSLDVLGVLCMSDLDFVVLDWEHGAWGASDSDTATLLAHGMGVAVVIRVPAPTAAIVQRAADTGADAIQFASMRSLDNFELMVQSSVCPPDGLRGYSPWSYRSKTTKESNSNPLLIPQIESVAGINTLFSLPETIINQIDTIFVGRFDLSVDLGLPGDINSESVTEALKKVVEFSNRYGKRVGTVALDLADANKMSEMGFGYITLSSDREILAEKTDSLFGPKRLFL